MSDPGQELHPRLARAHSDLHSATLYRDAIRMVDAGHFAAAIPPTHRSSVKGFVETALLHFHDLGFQQGLSGIAGGAAAGWSALDATEVAACRQRIESLLNRLFDEFRRQHRDVEMKWKQLPGTDPRKQQYFKEMNDRRRDLSKVLALDKASYIAKLMQLFEEAHAFGFELGGQLHTANDRKRKLGLTVEDIPVPIRLFVDPTEFESGDEDPHATFNYENRARQRFDHGQYQ